MRRSLVLMCALPVLTVGACGETMSDRALSGAGIGAGVGLVGGALAGNPLAGTLVGGAVGAGVGAMTTPNQIDLGRPAWR